MFDLQLGLASWQGLYSPIDPRNNPHQCLDMIYPPAKFDVDWSQETQVIVKKIMFDARPPIHWHPQSTNQVWLTSNSDIKQADLSAKKPLRWWIWQFWPELLSIPHKIEGQIVTLHFEYT